jgi:hypothetical protein
VSTAKKGLACAEFLQILAGGYRSVVVSLWTHGTMDKKWMCGIMGQIIELNGGFGAMTIWNGACSIGFNKR